MFFKTALRQCSNKISIQKPKEKIIEVSLCQQYFDINASYNKSVSTKADITKWRNKGLYRGREEQVGRAADSRAGGRRNTVSAVHSERLEFGKHGTSLE